VLAAVPLVAGSLGPTVPSFLSRIGGEPAAEATFLRDMATGERTRSVYALSERYELDTASTRVASFTSSITMRWRQFQSRVRWMLSRNTLLADIPAFFLIGFVVGRRRILQEAAHHRKALTWAAAVGLLASVVGTLVVYVMEPTSRVLDSLAWSLSDYGATMFYISAISLGVTFVPAVARVFGRLAPAGRIGLTNYLVQSTMMTLLFSHYGASLKEPSTAVWLALDLVFFFALQLPFSRWWIRHFRFGPAEWVWRSLTYGSPQPMRLEPVSAGGQVAPPHAFPATDPSA